MANSGNKTGPDDGLERLFAQARDDAPGADLAARVMADAQQVQAARSAPPRAAPAPARGWLSELVGGLGGWSAVSGITAAGVMGLAIGLYSPDTIAALIGDGVVPLSSSSYDLTPDIGELWTENGDV